MRVTGMGYGVLEGEGTWEGIGIRALHYCVPSSRSQGPGESMNQQKSLHPAHAARTQARPRPPRPGPIGGDRLPDCHTASWSGYLPKHLGGA